MEHRDLQRGRETEGDRREATASFQAVGARKPGFLVRSGHGQEMGKDGLVRKNMEEAVNRACLGAEVCGEWGKRSVCGWAGKGREPGIWSSCPVSHLPGL